MNKSLFAACFLMITGYVLAQPIDIGAPQTPSEQPNTDMETALKSADLDQAASAESIKYYKKMRQNYDALEKSLGKSFGGTWTLYDSSGLPYQVLALTSNVQIDKSLLSSDRYNIIYVKYNLKDITSTAKRITETYFKSTTFTPKIMEVFPDIMNNRVKVYVLTGEETRLHGILKQAGFDMEMIEVIPRVGPIQPATTLYGGQPIWVNNLGKVCKTPFARPAQSGVERRVT